jgi:PAS domain S-box-containing protein
MPLSGVLTPEWSDPLSVTGYPKLQRHLAIVTVIGMMLFVGVAVADLVTQARHIDGALYVALTALAVAAGREWLVWTTGAMGAVLTLLSYLVDGDSAHRVENLIALGAVCIIGVTLLRTSRLRDSALARLTETERISDRRGQVLEALGHTGVTGTWSLDLRTHPATLVRSAELCAILECDDHPFATLADLVSHVIPRDTDLIQRAFDRCIQDGTAFTEECELTNHTDEHKWVLITGSASTSAAGDRVVHGAIQDITSWRRSESAAETYHRRFSHFTNAVPDIIWTATPDGSIDYASDRLAEYTGRPVELFIGEEWLSLLHPDDLDATIATWGHAVATGNNLTFEYRLRNASGEFRWFRVQAHAEKDRNGDVLKWWGSAVDIEDIHRLQDRAQALAAQRDAVLESIGDGLCVMDSEGRISYINTRAKDLLAAGRDVAVGQKFWDVFHEYATTPVADAFKLTASTGTPQRLTHFFAHRDAWFEISPHLSATGMTVYLRDVTEMQDMTERLNHAQRLESVGQLTGGVAHDFNNLLTVVLGGAGELAEDSSLDDQARESVSMIIEAAQRGSELTHRLLAFARRQPLSPQTIDLSHHVTQFLPLVQRSLGDRIRITTNLGSDLPPAIVDPTQLDSSIMNLCINARDAITGQGEITLETWLADIDATYALAHADLLPGEYICLSIGDNGSGIPPDVVDHIFDPFFTTKGPGRGSGLGLAMVYGFVKQSQGHLAVLSEPGVGTVFRIYLPAAQTGPQTARQVPADRLASPGRPVPAQGARILVVEDDELVREFASTVLRSHGYQLHLASSGPQALEWLEHGEPVDLLFTDVIMPGGMTGKDLAKEFQRQRPGVPVLFASGFTGNLDLSGDLAHAPARLLPKPYAGKDLLEWVARSLGRNM